MIHFLEPSILFFCVVALIFLYVGGALSVFFMMHYIAKDRWRHWAEKNYGRDWRVIYIGGEFFLYIACFTAIALGYILIEAKLHNNWKPYIDSVYGMVWNRAVLIILIGYVSCLIISVANITKKQQRAEEGKQKRFSSYYKSKFTRLFVIFMISALMTIYIGERKKWMGNDNAYLEAKRYWAIGQVLDGFRLLLTRFIHPGLCVMTPLNSLQQVIFDKGIQYIPESDGERAVWENAWFYYHYSRLNRIAFKTIDWMGTSPATVASLDKWWHCLEEMATKAYADKQMEEEHYYQDYVSLALSYSSFEGIYSGKRAGSNARLAQDPVHVERSRELVRWLTELREKWQSTKRSRRLLAEFPKLEAMCQYTLLGELRDVIQGEIYAREFNCTNPSIQQYIALRKEFIAPEKGIPAIKRMKDRVAADTFYDWVTRSQSSTQYVIEHYCGYEVAGKEDFKRYEDWAKYDHTTPEEEAQIWAKANYRLEIKILEENYNGK